MKLQFKNQAFQEAATAAVCDVFEGQRANGDISSVMRIVWKGGGLYRVTCKKVASYRDLMNVANL